MNFKKRPVIRKGLIYFETEQNTLPLPPHFPTALQNQVNFQGVNSRTSP